jgi:DNA-binding MarR family transcriptional regulator
MTGRKPASRQTRSEVEVARVLDGVRRLDRGLRVAARQVERRAGMSAAQLFVLAQLSVEEPLSLNELARRTLTDRSSVSVVVDRLERAGFVSRRSAAGDRRRAEVRITPRGRRVLARAPQPPTRLLLDALHRLPRATVARLGRALDALNRDLGFADAQMLFEDR